MKPWVTLGEAQAPEGESLVLQQRGDEFVIRAGGHVLMSSRTRGSEEELARVGLSGSKGLHILVGGLGLGFTLRAVLDLSPSEARVTVSELVSEVVAWNRGPLAHLAGAPLEDGRVTVVEGDVRALVGRSPDRFDVILMDVDNGPSALTRSANDQLYGRPGVAALKRALRPGGRLVVWSAGPDQAFTERLRGAGFDVRVVPIHAQGQRHRLFLAQAGGGGSESSRA